ncbi:MAG TPA: zinc-binding alcohol dehydrogenase family protein [Mycobacteriales bacterium]|nr:zinc-binding alcohol dehydrogenase family protein [Mycobacteriales bacterium]
MIAALLTEHGRPPAPAEHALALPAPEQCRVKVTAAPIVPLDLLCASGTSYFGPPALPYVPGVSGVGLRDDGTRVWFSTDAGMRPGDGSLAEAAVVADAETVPLVDGVPDPLVAALGLSAVAAWMALTWRGGLRAGERVLVLGAGGTVGQVAVQAAAALGAPTVVAASRRERHRRRALDRGATATADLSGDADVDTLAGRLQEAAGGAVDLVVDPVGGAAATAALRVLGEHGRLVHLGASGGPTATFSSATLRSGSHSILGYTNNALTREQRATALTRVLELAASGRCEVAYETVPLADVTDAWVRAGAAPDGRLVVVP